MNNKKALSCVVALLFVVAVSCVLACVFITAGPGNADVADASSGAYSSEGGGDESQPVSYESPDSSSVEYSDDSEDESQAPVLILPPGIVINSQIAVVYDVNLGETIFAQNEETLTAPASLTKLLTALVALEYLSPERILTVGEEINLIGENSSIAFLAVGQRYTVKTLIDALLLPSGNDAAYVLAVNAARAAANDDGIDAESAVTAFVKLMNEKARSLGCVSSYFCTPDGYDADGQQVTASDMVKIALEACKNTTIAESAAKDKSGGWINSNALVRKDSSYYNEYVTGLKTGSTTDAGYCVAVSAVIGPSSYIMLFMNSATSEGRFADANSVIDVLTTNNQEIGADISPAA